MVLLGAAFLRPPSDFRNRLSHETPDLPGTRQPPGIRKPADMRGEHSRSSANLPTPISWAESGGSDGPLLIGLDLGTDSSGNLGGLISICGVTGRGVRRWRVSFQAIRNSTIDLATCLAAFISWSFYSLHGVRSALICLPRLAWNRRIPGYDTGMPAPRPRPNRIDHGAERLRELRHLIVSSRRAWRDMRVAASQATCVVGKVIKDALRSTYAVVSATLATHPGVLYLISGLWGVHSLHLCRFRLVGWEKISALPDWQITLRAAFWLGLLLLPGALVAAAVLRRWRGFVVTAIVVLCFEVLSQSLGRSMFKLVGDLGVWGTVLGGYGLRSHYSLRVVELLPRQQLGAFHSECLAVLRTAVNVCLFVIGTLGIAVTSNLVSQYFDGPLGQGTAWVHVGTMLYLAVGMAGLVIYPLFRAVVASRLRLSRE